MIINLYILLRFQIPVAVADMEDNLGMSIGMPFFKEHLGKMASMD